MERGPQGEQTKINGNILNALLLLLIIIHQ